MQEWPNETLARLDQCSLTCGSSDIMGKKQARWSVGLTRRSTYSQGAALSLGRCKDSRHSWRDVASTGFKFDAYPLRSAYSSTNTFDPEVFACARDQTMVVTYGYPFFNNSVVVITLLTRFIFTSPRFLLGGISFLGNVIRPQYQASAPRLVHVAPVILDTYYDVYDEAALLRSAP
ncbi:hypothetical protein OG21DRAFT_947178 [Imleria badia]|nr:hypothetical protein OG21DRAFT_947178 [Imleria badia]